MLKMNERVGAGLIVEIGRVARRRGNVAGSNRATRLAGGLVLLLALGGSVWAQDSKLGPPAAVTYDNKLEVYGGPSFMNFQAGQNLPKRMNMGGAEVSATYWLTKNWGLVGDYRGEAGTTPVFANPDFINRPVVYMNMGMFGAQYRGPRNQLAALNFHGYGGVSHGVFDAGTQGGNLVTTNATYNAQYVGLYSNRTSPIFAVGGSIDINRSKNWALRLSPDMIFEHFGTETREFFSISGGIVYRVPEKKAKKK